MSQVVDSRRNLHKSLMSYFAKFGHWLL